MASFSESLKNVFFLLVIVQVAPPIVKNIVRQYGNILEPKTKVGYLPIKGVLYNSTYYQKHLKSMFENNEIKAIVLKIESPGGASGTAEAIANEIAWFKKEYPKPIITLSENICTSGGYYIAASTDFIITEASTIVGSIGTVLLYQFKLNELLDKLHIKYNNVATGAYKTSTDPFIPSSPEQVKLLQAVTDASYENFIAHINKCRPKLLLQESKTWADGKVFSGVQALQQGLIDAIGSISTAENKIKELAIIEGSIEWIKPEKNITIWNSLFGTESKSVNFQESIGQFVQAVATGLH
jgi:protease IV